MNMNTTWTTLLWVTHHSCHLHLFWPDHRGHNCPSAGGRLGQSDITTGHRLPARQYSTCLVAGVLWPREWHHVLSVRILGWMSRGKRLLVAGNWKGDDEYVCLFYNFTCRLSDVCGYSTPDMCVLCRSTALYQAHPHQFPHISHPGFIRPSPIPCSIHFSFHLQFLQSCLYDYIAEILIFLIWMDYMLWVWLICGF